MKILVVGSLNMDVVIPLDRYPGSGETVTGRTVSYVPGGKGANQAVAAARMGAEVVMIGAIGGDDHADVLRGNLKENQVDVSRIVQVEGATGQAFVHVESDGSNRIILSKGANAALSPAHIQDAKQSFESADAVLLQLEIPLETVQASVEQARRVGVPVFLDPAPASHNILPILKACDWVVPNEFEIEMITSQSVSDIKTARIAAAKLLRDGANRVIVKLGANGALYADGDEFFYQPSFSVHACDTTAAGDAFVAGFVVDYLSYGEVRRALRFASVAGALATTKVGAQTSLPTREEVEKFLSMHNGR